MSNLMTEAELCRRLGISRVTAYRLREAGRLPHYRIGSRVLYGPEHVARFLAAHERPATSARKRGEAA